MTRHSRQVLIFGCGFSGLAIAQGLLPHAQKVVGTTRSPKRLNVLKHLGVTPALFDGKQLSTDLMSALEQTTHLLISIAPDDGGDVVLNAFNAQEVALPNLRWAGYLSTVGVYGNHNGKWVDETTTPRPVSKRSIQRLSAEEAWQAWAGQQRIPLAIFRLSGIYGPGRNAFINMEKGTARRLNKPGQVFNRIHREDIAKAVGLAAENEASGIFNITDNEPAPPQDVVTLAHNLAGKPAPPEMDFDTADLPPMARSFYGENKRVSNAKSKEELGMNYDWPNYRVALKQMWEEDSWRK